jgi:hypothetical protein
MSPAPRTAAAAHPEPAATPKPPQHLALEGCCDDRLSAPIPAGHRSPATPTRPAVTAGGSRNVSATCAAIPPSKPSKWVIGSSTASADVVMCGRLTAHYARGGSVTVASVREAAVAGWFNAGLAPALTAASSSPDAEWRSSHPCPATRLGNSVALPSAAPSHPVIGAPLRAVGGVSQAGSAYIY